MRMSLNRSEDSLWFNLLQKFRQDVCSEMCANTGPPALSSINTNKIYVQFNGINKSCFYLPMSTFFIGLADFELVDVELLCDVGVLVPEC